MLRQRGQQGEAHLAHSTYKWFLLHLITLVLQQVSGLVKDLQTLGTLEGSVLVGRRQTLVLLWITEV